MNCSLKYYNGLQKEYELNDVNSAKASAYRHKLLHILREIDEDEKCTAELERFWKNAYYLPLSKIRGVKDESWLSTMINVFKGELHTQLAWPTRHVALYNLYLGDLARYSSSTSTISSQLALIHYKKAVEANPDLGQAYNQLAILEKSQLSSIRYFILSISAGNPFHNSLPNLKKKLQQETNDRLLIILKDLLSCVFVSYSSNIDNIGAELIKRITAAEDPLALKSLPLIMNTLVLASNSPEEYSNSFLKLSSILCDLLLYLVNKVASYDEEEEIVVAQRRKTNHTEEDDSDDNDDGDYKRNVNTEKANVKESKKNANVWPLSVSCEWLLVVYPMLEKFKTNNTPIPAALNVNLDQFVNRLMEKLNNLIKTLDITLEEELEETEWLLNGPILGNTEEKAARCLRQVSYWSAILSASDVSPIEFAGYFRRRRQGPSGKQDVFRKMAELRTKDSIQKTVDDDWLPLYIVLDYDVLVNYLAQLRRILKSRVVIAIVPSFVLCQLDKMKGTGPSVRAAMRFIEQNQKSNDLRVEESASHVECCEKLIESTESASQLKTVVSLLVIDIEQYHSLTIPGVSVYHVESFFDRWEKCTINSTS